MARHSKWHKVKQFKGAVDAKRAASFTKLSREITIAAREKGGDPAMNSRLKAAIQKAKEVSMPKENIDRAIARGMGGSSQGEVVELMYEAFGPGGTAYLIEVLTDNRNRTVSELKVLLSKLGGSMVQPHSIQFLFERATDASEGYDRLIWKPKIRMEVAADVHTEVVTFIEALEDHDDVKQVYTNAV